MKKNRFLIFVFLFIGVFLFQYSSVSAYKFNARFFPGKGGYLKYDAKNSYESPKDQGKREIDSEKNINLTNYYVSDGCEFVGWVAERNNGATWYCKEGEASDCGSENNYAIYCSDSNRKYETGEEGKNAGFHAVWDCDGRKVYPEELGKTYEYYDIQYEPEEGSAKDLLGTQSVIIGQKNQLMDYNVDSFDGWKYGISKTEFLTSSHYVDWYCEDGHISKNCKALKKATNITEQAGNNGDLVIYQATRKKYKPTYTIVYISYHDDAVTDDEIKIPLNDDKIHTLNVDYRKADYAYEKVNYDKDVKLNPDIIQKEGKKVKGWYIYIYNLQDKTFSCYNQNTELRGAYLFSSADDYKEYFSVENCSDSKKHTMLKKNSKINIPFDSFFRQQVFSWSKDVVAAERTGEDSYVLYAQIIWMDNDDESSGYSDEDICKQQGNIWIKKGDSGYCSIDGLLYLKCGDIDEFPEVIPKILSYFVTLLKTVAPIVLIVFSIISLAKAISAGKEDEIKKAQTTLVKKIIIGALIFFVVTIVQFIMLKVADSSEKDNLTKCLSCFLNGTDDDNCNSIYYKHRGDSGTIEYKNVNK